jgi:hypothetical protein
MKRAILTLLFCAYYFFMPFVMVNCKTQDNPYALDETAAASTSLEVCQQMEYVTAECVQVLQQEAERVEEEKEAVAAAESAINDFIDCQSSFTSPAETATAEGSDAIELDVLDCPTIVQGMSDGELICASLTDDEKYAGCDNVEEAYANALAACEAGETANAAFCSVLSGS